MSSLFSFQLSSSTACSTSFGVQELLGWLSGWTNDWISPRWRRFRKPCSNHRRATCWRRRLVPYGLISRCRRCPRCRPPRLDGTFFLSLCSRKHTRWKRGRLCAHKFFSSASLSKFGQGLHSARRLYVGLSKSKPKLDGFCDGHKDFLQLYRYRLVSTFSTVDHVKNAQSCVNCVNKHRGTYGGTYENRTSFSTGWQDPKSLILIWDTGTSYGLTPFRSERSEAGVILLTMSSVKFLSGMSLRSTPTLHKFTDINGNPVYYLVSRITYPRQMFVCSLLKRAARCMVDTRKSMAIAYACY